MRAFRGSLIFLTRGVARIAASQVAVNDKKMTGTPRLRIRQVSALPGRDVGRVISLVETYENPLINNYMIGQSPIFASDRLSLISYSTDFPCVRLHKLATLRLRGHMHDVSGAITSYQQ